MLKFHLRWPMAADQFAIERLWTSVEVKVMRKVAGDAARAGFDAVEKKLIAVMVVGVVLMAGSSAWYFLG